MKTKNSNKNYSIIIPHYNIPDKLERLLNSIPVRDDVQIIVVDDCSPQPTIEALKKLQSRFPNVEWYSTLVNGGGGKARNVGLQKALGKFLIFADADDLFTILFADALDHYKDSDADIIYFSANSVDTETLENADRAEYFPRLLKRYQKSNNPEDLRYAFVVPWAKFIRHSIVKTNNISFDEVRTADDIMFTTKCDYYSEKLIADRHAIYCVTDRLGSVSKQRKLENIISHFETEIKRYVFFREYHKSHLPSVACFVPYYVDLQKRKDRTSKKIFDRLLTDSKISAKKVKKLLFVRNIRQIATKILAFFLLSRIHN